MDMTRLGPVDYAVIAFPGNRFDGSIAAELQRLTSQGVVRVIDLAFIKRDADGTVLFLELDGLGEDETVMFREIEGDVGGLMSDEDLALIAEEIPPNCSAALVVWEETWAGRLQEAISATAGVLVTHERIPAAVVEQDLAAIARLAA